jgi:PTH1 family peptidyl-tRNA hydrolase
MIRLIVGLGNPGPEYEDTRHNAGFWWVDRAVRQLGGSLQADRAYHGLVARVNRPAGPVWLLQPMTYMNLSGKSVAPLARFFKIAPEEILVVHDELDLPPGQMKLKQGGGNGGHNGLKDIQAQLGSPNFWRLRLGIGHPGVKAEVAAYVLRKPPAVERLSIDHTVDESLRCLELMLDGAMDKAMMKIHAKPPRPSRPASPGWHRRDATVPSALLLNTARPSGHPCWPHCAAAVHGRPGHGLPLRPDLPADALRRRQGGRCAAGPSPAEVQAAQARGGHPPMGRWHDRRPAGPEKPGTARQAGRGARKKSPHRRRRRQNPPRQSAPAAPSRLCVMPARSVTPRPAAPAGPRPAARPWPPMRPCRPAARPPRPTPPGNRCRPARPPAAAEQPSGRRARGRRAWACSASYLRCSCSRVSTWAGLTGMHSTGQTCTHWGSPKWPTHSVQRAGRSHRPSRPSRWPGWGIRVRRRRS